MIEKLKYQLMKIQFKSFIFIMQGKREPERCKLIEMRMVRDLINSE